jgi:hypothetical protein
LDATERSMAGSWSVYWYNGYMISSEIRRGLDIFELTPSAHISQNEIDAAKTVHFDYFNAQQQRKFVWPPSFVLARSYLDQLERSRGLSTDRIFEVRSELARAEGLSGQRRSSALTGLASDLGGQGRNAADRAKVTTLAGAGEGPGRSAVKDLAGAR